MDISYSSCMPFNTIYSASTVYQAIRIHTLLIQRVIQNNGVIARSKYKTDSQQMYSFKYIIHNRLLLTQTTAVHLIQYNKVNHNKN